MATSNATKIRQLQTPATDYGTAIKAFLNRCKSKNLSPRTLEYYQQRLFAYTRWINESIPGLTPDKTNTDHIRQFVTEETERRSAAMGQHAYVSVRVLFRWLFAEGFLDRDPTQRLERPKAPRKIITTFSNEQIENIINSCGKDFVGCRDRAIVTVLMDCGLRASEACSLTVDNINWTESILLVSEGKGGKDRIVPFGLACRKALSDYLGRRGAFETACIFVSCYGRPLTRYTLGDIIEKRCKKLDIQNVRLSAHTFRHTSAITLLRNGADVFSVQAFLGHSDLTMTKRYCTIVDSDITAMHRKCSPVDNLPGVKAQASRKRLK